VAATVRDLGGSHLRLWTRWAAEVAGRPFTPSVVDIGPVPAAGFVDSRGMTPDQLLQRITVDPAVCGGKPCVRGHRIWVSLVLGLLAGGMNVDDVLGEYPQLDEADVRACVAYGAKLADGRFVDLAEPVS
jgi:uncharacterized protein (DUF433 family)